MRRIIFVSASLSIAAASAASSVAHHGFGATETAAANALIIITAIITGLIIIRDLRNSTSQK